MVKLYGGEQPPPGPGPAAWRYEVELVNTNEFVSRKEKPDPRGDDVLECDCRDQGQREKGALICVDERCLNRATFTECVRCSKAGCANQRLRKGLWAETEVRPSGDKGWGLYLLEDIKVGQLVAEYVGEIINQKELDLRRKQRRRDRHLFFLQLGNSDYIDATEKGGLARFVNHACEPNCIAQRWRVGGEWRIGFFALQDMAAGTELSIDYGWEAVYGRKKTKCLCGTPGCRGFIEKDDTVALQAEETWSQIRGVVGTWRANRREEGEFGAALVGKKVRVYRPEQLRYVEGTVDSHDEDTGMHRVYYADGSEEEFNLATERWQLWAEAEDFVIKKSEAPKEGGGASALPPAHAMPPAMMALEEETAEMQVPPDAAQMLLGRGGEALRTIIRDTGVSSLELQRARSAQLAVIKGSATNVAAAQRRIQAVVKQLWAQQRQLQAQQRALQLQREQEEQRKSPEELEAELRGFDGRWCWGYDWTFPRALVEEVFYPPPSFSSSSGQQQPPPQQPMPATIPSPIVTRALDYVHAVAQRYPHVSDPSFLSLHAATLLLRYITLRPTERLTLALVDTAPACLLLALKAQTPALGGRMLKDFFEISYACRYPGHQAPLSQAADGDNDKNGTNGGGRVLTPEGSLWQGKVVEAEAKLLDVLGYDIYLSDPFPLLSRRRLLATSPPLPLEDQPEPASSQEMTKTAERVLRRAAYTPVFLLHNVPVVAAAAALVGQLVAYQHAQAASFGGGVQQQQGHGDASSLMIGEEVAAVVEEYGEEVQSAAALLLRLEISNPDFAAALIATRLRPALLAQRGGQPLKPCKEPPCVPPRLSAESIPLRPALEEGMLTDERPQQKIRGRYCRLKDDDPTTEAVKDKSCSPWQRYLQGRLFVRRWPTEKSAQHEAKVTRASGFSPGLLSPAALRELFILQRLHQDAARRKGCPFLLTPLALVKGQPPPLQQQPHPPHVSRKGKGKEEEGGGGLSPLLTLEPSSSSNHPSTTTTTQAPSPSSSSSSSLRMCLLAFERAQYSLSHLLRHCAAAAADKGKSNKALLGPALQRAWATNLLEGIKWCHERGVLLRSIDPALLYLDRNGTLKLGCFDDAILLPPSSFSSTAQGASGSSAGGRGSKERAAESASALRQLDEKWDESKRRRKSLMAPEVLLGADASAASDMWSVGCILSLLLLGRPPFLAESGRQLMEHIYRVCGSYDTVWRAGTQLLPLYERCKPQKHANYACRTPKHVREMAQSARSKRRLEVSDAGVALLPAILQLEPSARATALDCLRHSPYLQPFPIPEEAETDLNARVAEWARLSSTAPPLLASATAKPYAPPDASGSAFDVVGSEYEETCHSAEEMHAAFSAYFSSSSSVPTPVKAPPVPPPVPAPPQAVVAAAAAPPPAAAAAAAAQEREQAIVIGGKEEGEDGDVDMDISDDESGGKSAAITATAAPLAAVPAAPAPSPPPPPPSSTAGRANGGGGREEEREQAGRPRDRDREGDREREKRARRGSRSRSRSRERRRGSGGSGGGGYHGERERRRSRSRDRDRGRDRDRDRDYHRRR